jgi:hypothetical protein
MASMWELPSASATIAKRDAWRTFRHSITVTDYTVHVTRGSAKGKWVAIKDISDVPITGLTRKILKAAGII